ncbi:hypothetical protein IQ247_03160 [Plectonema cf. radiosum LEGE 06105]|uniref:Uncharacterized protein n=1 Tax=Plectonema cf. radiosum LEGE 06105 TaxID=945769 RepID=A0A8J7JRU2_9CYAN|nr:hypothetical protein [Plectonema radiosum]MBE9211724.1 hypothetical protein [Plectonema cf. radiosum LEGE 06105]
MATIFSLSVECGADEASAKEFSRHFDNIEWVLANGQRSQLIVNLFQDIEENWWCRIVPSGISSLGIDTPETAFMMTELGLMLYQRLKSAPSFRYALVGIEVDEFRTYSELIENPSELNFPGLVIAENIWQELGSSRMFRAFSLGYVWKTYEGEVYKPLITSLDLKNKLHELLILQ